MLPLYQLDATFGLPNSSERSNVCQTLAELSNGYSGRAIKDIFQKLAARVMVGIGQEANVIQLQQLIELVKSFSNDTIDDFTRQTTMGY